jgi:AraC family transcriptional regulator
MQIEWKDQRADTPFLFRQVAEWNGVRVHRARVIAGRMLEHTAPCHEINITLGGKLFREGLSDSGRRLMATSDAGNMCVTPAGKSVAASWDDTIDNMGILLDSDFAAKTAAENHFSTSFHFMESVQREDPMIQHMGLALLDEAKAESPSGRLYADSIIQTLTLHLLKNYTTAKNAIREAIHGGLSGYRLRRVKEFIHANLEEDLSLAEIAGVADLSQFHFARAFRKSTGMTPQQYLMQQRIESAKTLLTQADLPLVEVSLRTGFKNQSHFTALFRKFTSFTPKAWRELKLA